MPTVPNFYEREIPESHWNIFMLKIQFLFVDLRGNFISNNFSIPNYKNEFSLLQKIGTVNIYKYDKHREQEAKLYPFHNYLY